MDTSINIDGVDYVRLDSVSIKNLRLLEDGHVIVIAANGWIFVGREEIGQFTDPTSIHLVDASVVRCWNNGKGIGGLAIEANKSEYTLDAVGEISVFNTIARILCEW